MIILSSSITVIMRTRTQSGVHTTANVYKHIHAEILMYDILWQPTCTQTHTFTYTCTPVTAAPLGGALWGLPFSAPAPVTWIMHKKRNEHVNLCSPPRGSLPFPPSPPRFIPRRVKPASYDNSAPRDMLTLLVESPIAPVSQLSSQKVGPGCETDKRKHLNSRSFLQHDIKGTGRQYDGVAHLENRRKSSLNSGKKLCYWARYSHFIH